MKSFSDIQAEIGLWAAEQFKDNVSKDKTAVHYGHPLGSIPAILGMVEELGELSRVVARRIQGRGYEQEAEALAAKQDALADCLVFMCDYATREGIHLNQVLDIVWLKVKLRRQATWVQDKAKEPRDMHSPRLPTQVKIAASPIQAGLSEIARNTETPTHGAGSCETGDHSWSRLCNLSDKADAIITCSQCGILKPPS